MDKALFFIIPFPSVTDFRQNRADLQSGLQFLAIAALCVGMAIWAFVDMASLATIVFTDPTFAFLSEAEKLWMAFYFTLSWLIAEIALAIRGYMALVLGYAMGVNPARVNPNEHSVFLAIPLKAFINPLRFATMRRVLFVFALSSTIFLFL